jgi:flagellar hook-associated protein 1 FlgK
MATGILGIATSGLATTQYALATTGHNIANATTEGYSKQRVEQTEREPSFSGAGFVGNGVDLGSITRTYDNFIETQIRTSSSAYQDLSSYHQMATQVDNFIADADTSLTPSLQSFFSALGGVANDPTSVASRKVMLTEGDTLTHRFNTLNDRFETLRSQVNQDLSIHVKEINEMAKNIASLNQRVVEALGQSQGKPPNDLLDQRNLLVMRLSEKINTTAYEESNGALNVFVGNGQSLILGTNANQLKIQESAYDPLQKDIAIGSGTSPFAVITSSISGGKIGGLFKFNNEVLNPAQTSLGRIAAGFAISFNTQHVAGVDLNGNPGTQFFTDLTDVANNPQSWFASSSNVGNARLSVSFDNSADNGPTHLMASDYRLTYDGSGYTLTRTYDNMKFTSDDGSFKVDGLNISVAAGSPEAKDNFLIRPFQHVASNIQTLLTDHQQIAAASSPFTGPGDNTNARALARLQVDPILSGGAATLQDAYGEITANVATRTRAADINSQAQQKLLEQAQEEREKVSGVNLDEEAANLLRYQQAYQAAAQLVPVFKDMFDNLIAAVRS